MTVVAEITKKINQCHAEMLVESDIASRIEHSSLTQKEKENFLKLLSYFTPDEIEELKLILG